MVKKISITFILFILSVTSYAATPEEKYTTVPDKKNTHESGKVKMVIFFDFFCPHCHEFDTVVVPLLQREYGKRLQVTYMGLPIIYEDSIIPVEAYELAKDEGKGEEMKNAIFDAIYYQRKDGANLDILTSLAKSIGLDATVPVNGAVTATPGPMAGQITLNWSGFTDALSGIDRYKAVYATGAAPLNCSSGTAIYTGSAPTYLHISLSSGTTYYYRVCAIDKAGNMSTGATTNGKPLP